MDKILNVVGAQRDERARSCVTSTLGGQFQVIRKTSDHHWALGAKECTKPLGGKGRTGLPAQGIWAETSTEIRNWKKPTGTGWDHMGLWTAADISRAPAREQLSPPSSCPGTARGVRSAPPPQGVGVGGSWLRLVGASPDVVLGYYPDDFLMNFPCFIGVNGGV